MKKTRFIGFLTLSLAAIGALTGCATSSTSGTHSTADNDGSKLWAQNCIRCHNGRSPGEFSSAQWDIVMLHMRIRAGLAAEDARAIREFLQTAN